MLTAVAELPASICPQSAGTILVAEDEEMVRLCVAEFLEDCGYRVLQASDVAEARAILSGDQHIDLVFSDVNMPGEESGFALARLVLRHYPQTKILLTSGFPHDDEEIKDLLEPLIPKPYNYDSVLGRIQNIL